MTSVKIVSDGTAPGTTIVNADTGEPLPGRVTAIAWTVDADENRVAKAHVTYKVAEVEVLGEAA